ncbi:hypothetical protein Bpfe_014410 [Biomphalaria pfeifferi]|uniref:Uncharacterized protein n=1 Tax=Biomphalaria pfeifferi TaxID=112525 RepID=A0AAD8BK03_BIOPF|nr:hypothetical protein Bpfe_014410 [Biomphalaria pfeifferi]
MVRTESSRPSAGVKERKGQLSEFTVKQNMQLSGHGVDRGEKGSMSVRSSTPQYRWIGLEPGSVTCGSRATCGSLDVKLRHFTCISKYYLFYRKQNI